MARRRCAVLLLAALLSGAALAAPPDIGKAVPSPPPAPFAGSAATPGGSHPREFWRAIQAHDFALPAGASAYELIRELSAWLASPDPEMRDELAYEISAAWIYRDHRLTSTEIKELLGLWRGNLQVGIGETGTDSVLRRSFSALALSILAALDLERPFLSQDELEALLGSAIDYLSAESDLRGFEPRVGWIHAAAHDADLLKFLGRNAKLRAGDPQRILGAIVAKLEAVHEPFTHGEPERLARAVLSLALRRDAPPAPLETFVATLAAREQAMWKASSLPAPALYAAVQNGHELLQSLCVLLDQQPSLAPRLRKLRAKVLAALAAT